jgi:hypothetical protein
MQKLGAAAAVCVALALTGCEETEAEKARNAALDKDLTPVANCETNTMRKVTSGILVVSWGDFSRICELYGKHIGGLIPISVLRKIGLASGLMKVEGLKSEIDQIAYQIISIAEARHIEKPEAMVTTTEIAWKVFKGSDGRVTPRDLNVALRNSGRAAQTMDDAAIYVMAVMIDRMRRAQGE